MITNCFGPQNGGGRWDSTSAGLTPATVFKTGTFALGQPSKSAGGAPISQSITPADVAAGGTTSPAGANSNLTVPSKVAADVSAAYRIKACAQNGARNL
jgi:hypothetical protein